MIAVRNENSPTSQWRIFEHKSKDTRSATSAIGATVIVNVATCSKVRAQSLATDADSIVQSAFLQHFPEPIVTKLGLVLAADGSFGREMLVPGRSDIDLTFYATKADFSDLDQLEQQEFYLAKEEFTSDIRRRLRVLDLTVEDRYPCRLAADIAAEIKKSASGVITDIKIAAEAITKFCSIRPLCGDDVALNHFPKQMQSVWAEIVQEPELKNQAVRTLVRLGSDIVAGHGLYRTVQDVKECPLTLATISTALCHLLKNENNSEVLDTLRSDLLERSYFICAVREFLPRDGQILGPTINEVLPRAIQRIYGNQPDIVPLTYRSCARIAANFDYLLEESCKQGCLAISGKYSEPATFNNDLLSTAQVKGIFYKPGNVALYLHYGLLREGFNESLPEFAMLDGEPDVHDYQRLTLGEHSVVCAAQLDELFRGHGDPRFVSLTRELKPDDIAILFLALTLHDSGKPEEQRIALLSGGFKIDPEYHAEFGSKLAKAAALRIGFTDEQSSTISTLIEHHLWFRQTKGELRENMTNGVEALPEGLRSSKVIKMLALLAFADDASTDPAGWNALRANHVYELCHAYTCLLENKPNGLALKDAGAYAEFLFAQHGGRIQDANLAALREHLSLFPATYLGLPPETICSFYQLSKAAAISQEPQVQIIPHQLFDFEKGTGNFRYDVLFVGPDKPFLASNIAEILARHELRVHSAAFAVNKDGMVFNQFTVTHQKDISDSIADISLLITKRANFEKLAVPKVKSFTFDNKLKISTSAPESRAGDTASMEIILSTVDKEKLLLRFLVGLNNLNLSIMGAEITTSTGSDGKMIAVNRFRVVNTLDPNVSGSQQELRNKLRLEFKNPDESASGL